MCSVLEGTQGYSGTVTPIVCGIRLDTQEQVFPANSYTFVQEKRHKKPTISLQLSLSIKKWLYNTWSNVVTIFKLEISIFYFASPVV